MLGGLVFIAYRYKFAVPSPPSRVTFAQDSDAYNAGSYDASGGYTNI
jgi:hypothetical protein